MRRMRMAVYPGKMWFNKESDISIKAQEYLNELLEETQQEKEDHILDALNYAKEATEKCDIIDIAERELENIDTTEIDQECNNIMIPELINKMIVQWRDERKKLTYDEEKTLESMLGIQNIIYKERYIMFRNWHPTTQKEFSKKTDLFEEGFIIIPEINGVSEKIIILMDQFQKPTIEAVYDEERLIEKLKELGLNDSLGEKQFESYIDYLIRLGLKQNSDIMDDDTYIRCNVEDKVVAIGINKTLSDPKTVFSQALRINPNLFIEICGIGSTVLLIDTRRWVLEEKESCEEDIWYQ